jgi:hypothetical protein
LHDDVQGLAGGQFGMLTRAIASDAVAGLCIGAGD